MSTAKKRTGGTPAKRAAAAAADRPSSKAGGRQKIIALYEVMKAGEGFDDIAEHLHQMIKKAIVVHPGARRVLYLDIDEHRNEAGGFDDDSYELQQEFIVGFLMPFLSEVHMPLTTVTNPKPQRDDIPQHLRLIAGGPAAEREEHLRSHAQELGGPVFDSQTGEDVQADGTRTPHRG